MRKSDSAGMWSFTVCSVVLLALCLSACGEEESICRKAFNAYNESIIAKCKKLEGREDCWLCPCQCYFNGMSFVPIVDERGLPDVEHPICDPEELCEGDRKYWAEGCLADVEACQRTVDPFYNLDYGGIHICDPVFSEHIAYGECNLYR